MSIAQTEESNALNLVGSLSGILYPNGEVVVYKARPKARVPLKALFEDEYTGGYKSLYNVALMKLGILPPLEGALGLSPLPNFDKLDPNVLEANEGKPRIISRYGRNGITSYGARRVRNACYLIQQNIPKMCAVFSTCTVPALPIESMRRLHENWHKVVDAFRRKLRRELRENGLSGDSVTVSEVQSKRYENTGVPVLHIHTVFHGRRRDGKAAISTKKHDDIWRESLEIALGEKIPEMRSACNLQWVKKSAEGYLGKYMTKGTKVVNELCLAGFEGWLPKQWWSVSRSLGKMIDKETRRIDEFGEWLNNVADDESSDVWLWHRKVLIEMASGDVITIARYGRLAIRQSAYIHAYYKEKET